VTESHYERTLVALVTALAAIRAGNVYDVDSGAVYWYDVNNVLRWPALSSECINTSNDTVYVVSEDDTPIDDAGATVTRERARITLDLSVLHRFTDIADDPFAPPDPQRQTVQSRVIQDAKGCLMAINRGDRLGGLVTWISCRLETRAADKTFFSSEPWACGILRLEIDCFYSDLNP